MTEREWEHLDEALVSLRDEPLEDITAAVRERTLARVRRERRVWWSVGALAAMLLLALGIRSRPAAVRVAPPPVAVERQQAAEPVIVPVAQPRPPVRRAVRKPKPEPEPEPEPKPLEPMKIQMLTDDPDIVIVWLVGD